MCFCYCCCCLFPLFFPFPQQSIFLFYEPFDTGLHFLFYIFCSIIIQYFYKSLYCCFLDSVFFWGQMLPLLRGGAVGSVIVSGLASLLFCQCVSIFFCCCFFLFVFCCTPLPLLLQASLDSISIILHFIFPFFPFLHQFLLFLISVNAFVLRASASCFGQLFLHCVVALFDCWSSVTVR